MSPADDDKRVEPLELFFDLVFVFALTQVTARLADDLSWAGLGRAMLILATIWWAWAAYSWLTNEVDRRSPLVRLVIFASMACMLLASLAIPGAFEGDALLFAAAYLGVRVLHVALFIAATEDLGVRAAARALAPTAVLAPALLLLGAAVDGPTQTAVWIAALGIDYVGGALRGIEGWRLSPGHFAERYGLIVIIALGESIVAIGAGAEDVPLDAAALLSASLGVVLAACLWWLYFDDELDRVVHRLEDATGAVRNVLARDAFAFLHLPLIAGIVLLALGVKKAVGDVDEPLKAVRRRRPVRGDRALPPVRRRLPLARPSEIRAHPPRGRRRLPRRAGDRRIGRRTGHARSGHRRLRRARALRSAPAGAGRYATRDPPDLMVPASGGIITMSIIRPSGAPARVLRLTKEREEVAACR